MESILDSSRVFASLRQLPAGKPCRAATVRPRLVSNRKQLAITRAQAFGLPLKAAGADSFDDDRQVPRSAEICLTPRAWAAACRSAL